MARTSVASFSGRVAGLRGAVAGSPRDCLRLVALTTQTTHAEARVSLQYSLRKAWYT